MDPGRLAVTVLGLGLIVAVNLGFFARPGTRRVPGRRGRAGVKPPGGPADDGPGTGSRTDQPSLTRPGHAPPAHLPTSKEP